MFSFVAHLFSKKFYLSGFKKGFKLVYAFKKSKFFESLNFPFIYKNF